MELERVARRLAVDQGYRRRAAEGLRSAAASGGSAGADVLARVKRLNDYLATGLAILDDNPPAPLGPLPWEQPAKVEQQPQQAQQAHQLQAQPAADSSPEDSDIEEEEGGQSSADAVAALLAEAQAAVQRRQAAAALTIQCAFRRHRAQSLLQQLKEQRCAADRLVARALAAAYRGVCGSRRTLAGQVALRQLQRLRRWRLRQRRLLGEAADVQEAAADVPQAAEAHHAAADAAEVQLEPPQRQGAPLDVPASTEQALQESTPSAQPGPADAGQTNGPPAELHPGAPVRPASARRVGTPPVVLITAPGPPPSGFLSASRHHTSSSGGGSRSGSPAQQQQPWQQRQASPLALGAQARSSSGGGPAQVCLASPLQQAASPPRTASGLHSSSSRKEPYRRSSSIQLLEAVQLVIDCAGGSVASQAALGVCERAQQRVQELQRSASQGRPGIAGGGSGAAGHRIGRVGSGRAARQASGRAWPGEAIPE